MGSTKKLFCVLLTLVLLLSSSLSGCGKEEAQSNVPALLTPAKVEAGTAVVERGDLYNTVILPVRALPKTEELSFPMAGTIKEIYVVAGQEVKEGDALVALDQEALEKAIEAKQAEIDSILIQHRDQEGAAYSAVQAALLGEEQASKVLSDAEEELAKTEKEQEESRLKEESEKLEESKKAQQAQQPEEGSASLEPKGGVENPEDSSDESSNSSVDSSSEPEGSDSSDDSSSEPEGSDSSDDSSSEPEGSDSSDDSSSEPEGSDSSDDSSSEPEGSDSSDDSSSEPEGSDSSDDSSSEPEGSDSSDDSSSEPEGSDSSDDSSSEPESSDSSEDSSSKPDSSDSSEDSSSKPDSSSESEESSDDEGSKPDGEKNPDPIDYEKVLELQRKLVRSAEYGVSFSEIALRKAQLQYYQIVEENALEETQLYRQLADLKDQLGKNVLYAPSDGRIVDVNYYEGQWVEDYATVAILAMEDQLYLVGNPYNNDSILQAIKIDVEIAGEVYPVEYEAYEKDDYMRRNLRGETLKTYFIMKEGTASYGQDGILRLYYGISLNTLYLPKSCVMSDKFGSYVYKDVDGRKEKVYIALGISTTSAVEVVSGLEEGDVVYENE